MLPLDSLYLWTHFIVGLAFTLPLASLQLQGLQLSAEELMAEEMAQEVSAPHVNFYDPSLFQDLQAEVRTDYYSFPSPVPEACLGAEKRGCGTHRYRAVHLLHHDN